MSTSTHANKIAAIVDAAMTKSDRLISAIPESRLKVRTNANNIVQVCKELVAARPSQEPTASRVAGIGAARFARFPAAQSLLNSYPEQLRIWRDAYHKAVSIYKPSQTRSEGFELDEAQLTSLDHGTRAQVTLLQALFKQEKRDNDRLRSIIRAHMPVSHLEATGPLSGESHGTEPLRKWLADLHRGLNGLEATDLGVRISRLARPGQVIISSELLTWLRNISKT